MRFHVVGLPHTQTTKEYLNCAYTQKILNFCKMMISLGHEVFLYGGLENEAPCTEFIKCYPRKIPKEDYLSFGFNVDNPEWVAANNAVIFELKARYRPRDFLCVIAGLCNRPIADAYPDMLTVEYGIGYGGVFSNFRVFESYAWMHTMYGQLYGATTADSRDFDAVIPNYFDVNDFPIQETKGDYFLYLGRITERKGYQVAIDVCKEMGKKLVLAGPMDKGIKITYGDYIGSVDLERRKVWLGGAAAVFTPTRYIEPFCGVHVEAMLCGTRVITSDHGAFTEYVPYGVGYRCRMFKEYCDAVEKLGALEGPNTIGQYARNRFSLDVVKLQYEYYFKRLLTIYDKGWYQKEY